MGFFAVVHSQKIPDFLRPTVQDYFSLIAHAPYLDYQLLSNESTSNQPFQYPLQHVKKPVGVSDIQIN